MFYFMLTFGRHEIWRYDGKECKRVDKIPPTARELDYRAIYVNDDEEGSIEGIYLLIEYLEERYFTTKESARTSWISGPLKRLGVARELISQAINLYKVHGMDERLLKLIRIIEPEELIYIRNKDEFRALVARTLLQRI